MKKTFQAKLTIVYDDQNDPDRWSINVEYEKGYSIILGSVACGGSCKQALYRISDLMTSNIRKSLAIEKYSAIEEEALKKRTFDSFDSLGLGVDKTLWAAVDKETITGGCAPVGLPQRKIWLQARLTEIKQAIERYVSVNKDIPYQWIVEHDSLDREIDSLETEEKA